jgi:hypothetical protein
VTQIDEITQASAATALESATTAGQVKTQAERMNVTVRHLSNMVGTPVEREESAPAVRAHTGSDLPVQPQRDIANTSSTLRAA